MVGDDPRADPKDFSEGLAAFWSNGKWGFIDHRGHTAIRPIFSSVSPFSTGIATVSLKSRNEPASCLYAVIDRKGHYVIPPRASFLGWPSEGYVRFAQRTNGNERYGYFSSNGEVVIPASFESAKEFSEGMARVRIGTGEAFIGRDGKVIIPGPFAEAADFSDGVALVRSLSNGLYGYVDHLGNYRIAAKYEDAHSFIAGFAEVVLQQSWRDLGDSINGVGGKQMS
jgi:hypothetical protein